jgi:AdoMet-dependent heme synthase
LTTNEVFELLDQLRNAGVIDLAISGGEPLLRADIYKIIGRAKILGFAVGIGSNGSSVTPKAVERLLESGVDRLQVSLDGLAEAHDRLRCWPGLFARALRGAAIACKGGLPTHVCCTINRYNFSQLEKFTEFIAVGTAIDRINFSRYVPTGRGNDRLDLEDEQWRAVIATCTQLRAAYRGRLDIVTHLAQQILVDPYLGDMPAFVGCQAGAGQGCVTSEGTVFPCVLLPIPLGNIRATGFEEIWRTSPVIHNLQHRAKLEGLCGSCPAAAKCGGCRAVAFAKTGNYMATDPRCWLGSC